MQVSMEGAERFGALIGHFLGTALIAAMVVYLDSFLPSLIKEVILTFGVALWFFSTSTRDAPWKTHALQFIKFCALGGLFYYSFYAHHGLTICWGMYLLLERMIRTFLVYLQTESPPGEELIVYLRMKHLVLVYSGTAVILTNFSAIAAFIYWPVRITLVPGVCAAIVIGMRLVWESNRDSRQIRDTIISVLVGLLLRVPPALLYIWDRVEMLEGLVLFWLPRYISVPCAWIELRWLRWRGVQQYEYSSCPLDENNNEVRLLRLKRRGIFSGLLKAELVSASIDNPPLYEALSYSWGGAIEKKAILLNGKLFYSFVSAHSLLYARSSWFKEQLLWVDAICINQDDLIERSKQVQIMRNIYGSAARVVVWPGDTPNSRLASAMLYDIYSTEFEFEGSAYDFEKWYFNERYSPRWLALVEFLKKPYFSRIWVLQEVAVASNVQVLHGGLYIPWDIMNKVMIDLLHPHRRAILSYTSNPEMRTFHQSRSGDPAMNVSVMWLVREQHGKVCNENRLPLGKLLSLCTKFKSTDPRDKIFALVGLAAATAPPLTTIDYSEAPARVYIKSTVNILRQEHNPFNILANSGIGYRKRTDVADVLSNTLPSWVPDWSSERVGYTLASRNDIGGGYCTFTHSEPTLEFSSLPGTSLKTLSLKGILIDRIQERSCSLDTERESGEISISDYSTTINRWYQQARDMAAEKARDPYPENQSLNEAFWRTIIGDGHQYRPAPPEFGHYYSKWIELLALLQAGGSHAGIEDMMKTGLPEAEGIASWLEDATINAGIRDFSNCFAEIAVGRRFCVTQNGYIGLVPPETKDGDLVCIIAGAPTPYLLRRFANPPTVLSTEAFQLVGECYIHGMMDRSDIFEEDMRMLIFV